MLDGFLDRKNLNENKPKKQEMNLPPTENLHQMQAAQASQKLDSQLATVISDESPDQQQQQEAGADAQL